MAKTKTPQGFWQIFRLNETVPGELLCKDVNGLHSLEANNCLSAGISPTFVFVRD